MTEKDAIRRMMKTRGITQATLAEKAGFGGQTNITGLLNNNRHGIRIDKLLRLTKAMGYEIVIRDASGKEEEIVIDTSSDAE